VSSASPEHGVVHRGPVTDSASWTGRRGSGRLANSYLAGYPWGTRRWGPDLPRPCRPGKVAPWPSAPWSPSRAGADDSCCNATRSGWFREQKPRAHLGPARAPLSPVCLGMPGGGHSLHQLSDRKPRWPGRSARGPLLPTWLGIAPRGHSLHRPSDREPRWHRRRSPPDFGSGREEGPALTANAAISVRRSPNRDLTRSLR